MIYSSTFLSPYPFFYDYNTLTYSKFIRYIETAKVSSTSVTHISSYDHLKSPNLYKFVCALLKPLSPCSRITLRALHLRSLVISSGLYESAHRQVSAN